MAVMSITIPTGGEAKGRISQVTKVQGVSMAVRGVPPLSPRTSMTNQTTLFNLCTKVMPIVDLLAISNTHFQKLKHFIHMQLPSGFPVKIEIPLFHVINAQITFSNIQVFVQTRLIAL